MRNPGRRDGDDARPDPTDPSTPQAGSAEEVRRTTVPPVCPHPTAQQTPPTSWTTTSASPPATRRTRRTSPTRRLRRHLLFDPLLSDEPIDLAAVRADDALIDALGGGDLVGADDLVDPDDPLIAMLAAWAASARPEAEAASPIVGRARLCRPGADRRSAPAARGRDAGRRDRRRRIREYPGLAARRESPTSVQGPPTQAMRTPATPTPTTPPTPRIWIRPPSGCCLPPGSARAPSRAPTPTPPTRPVRYASSARPPLPQPPVPWPPRP